MADSQTFTPPQTHDNPEEVARHALLGKDWKNNANGTSSITIGTGGLPGSTGPEYLTYTLKFMLNSDVTMGKAAKDYETEYTVSTTALNTYRLAHAAEIAAQQGVRASNTIAPTPESHDKAPSPTAHTPWLDPHSHDKALPTASYVPSPGIPHDTNKAFPFTSGPTLVPGPLNIALNQAKEAGVTKPSNTIPPAPSAQNPLTNNPNKSGQSL